MDVEDKVFTIQNMLENQASDITDEFLKTELQSSESIWTCMGCKFESSPGSICCDVCGMDNRAFLKIPFVEKDIIDHIGNDVRSTDKITTNSNFVDIITSTDDPTSNCETDATTITNVAPSTFSNEQNLDDSLLVPPQSQIEEKNCISLLNTNSNDLSSLPTTQCSLLSTISQVTQTIDSDNIAKSVAAEESLSQILIPAPFQSVEHPISTLDSSLSDSVATHTFGQLQSSSPSIEELIVNKITDKILTIYDNDKQLQNIQIGTCSSTDIFNGDNSIELEVVEEKTDNLSSKNITETEYFAKPICNDSEHLAIKSPSEADIILSNEFDYLESTREGSRTMDKEIACINVHEADGSTVDSLSSHPTAQQSEFENGASLDVKNESELTHIDSNKIANDTANLAIDFQSDFIHQSVSSENCDSIHIPLVLSSDSSKFEATITSTFVAEIAKQSSNSDDAIVNGIKQDISPVIEANVSINLQSISQGCIDTTSQNAKTDFEISVAATATATTSVTAAAAAAAAGGGGGNDDAEESSKTKTDIVEAHCDLVSAKMIPPIESKPEIRITEPTKVVKSATYPEPILIKQEKKNTQPKIVPYREPEPIKSLNPIASKSEKNPNKTQKKPQKVMTNISTPLRPNLPGDVTVPVTTSLSQSIIANQTASAVVVSPSAVLDRETTGSSQKLAGNKRKTSGVSTSSMVAVPMATIANVAPIPSPSAAVKVSSQTLAPPIMQIGMKSWKRQCVLNKTAVTHQAIVEKSQGPVKAIKSNDVYEKSSVNQYVSTVVFKTVPVPTLDDAVYILGHAPSGGLSGSIHKPMSDSTIDMRRMMMQLNAEMNLAKKSTAKACKDKDRENAGLEGGKDSKSRISAASERQREQQEKDEKEKEEQEDWVQCDNCSKWRRLPLKTNAHYPTELPERWTCSMNKWDTKTANCSSPEDTFVSKEMTSGAIKLKIWLRRLRSGDRFESRSVRQKSSGSSAFSAAGFALRNAALFAGGDGRDPGEVDWIRCANTSCGKWRACLRSMDIHVLKEMYPTWYCWMNSWDDAKASCNAPQEGSSVRSLVPVKANSFSSSKIGTLAKGSSFKGAIYGDSGDYEGDVWREDENDDENENLQDNSTGGGISSNSNSAGNGTNTGSGMNGVGAGGRREKNVSTSSSQPESAVPVLTLQGVSSKGRIVRSRWNTRQGRK